MYDKYLGNEKGANVIFSKCYSFQGYQDYYFSNYWDFSEIGKKIFIISIYLLSCQCMKFCAIHWKDPYLSMSMLVTKLIRYMDHGNNKLTTLLFICMNELGHFLGKSITFSLFSEGLTLLFRILPIRARWIWPYICSINIEIKSVPKILVNTYFHIVILSNLSLPWQTPLVSMHKLMDAAYSNQKGMQMANNQ
jgi:hypothetical protein